MMKAPYNAMDVANYIVKKAIDRQQPVTHLKLQKLLYYVVAKYLKDTGEYLIAEPIYKWQFGPVVKEVYHAFKTYGSEVIKSPYAYLKDSSVFMPDENGRFPEFKLYFENPDAVNTKLDGEEAFKNTVNDVMDELLSKGPFELVERTHQEEAWLSYKSAIFSREAELEYSQDELRRANI